MYAEHTKGRHIGKQVPASRRRSGLYHLKDADITAVFEVELPELFTVTAAEYEAIHAAWAKVNQGIAQLYGGT